MTRCEKRGQGKTFRPTVVRASLLALLPAIVVCCAPGGSTPAGASSALPPNKLSSHDARAILDSESDRYWKAARKEVYRSANALAEQHSAETQKTLRYRTLISGSPNRKMVALTFDDGPHPQFTPRILDVLEENNVRATFFVVGEMAEKYPWLVRREIMGGNSVGNHTYHHVSLVKIPAEDAAVEIKACGKVLERITGRAPHLFRPPGGDYSRAVAEAAARLGYTMVLWTDDPGDYASLPGGAIEKRVLRRIGPGGIILIHDGMQQTIAMLPRLIHDLKARGYDLVTVDQLIGGLAR